MLSFLEYYRQLLEAETPTEKRTMKNLPRYSTGKPKVPFTEWLGLKGQGSKGFDGKYYGWSHRAVWGFGVGDTIKIGHIGNKYQYSSEVQKKCNAIAAKGDYKEADAYYQSITFKPYKIETEEEAKEHAIRFGKDVS